MKAVGVMSCGESCKMGLVEGCGRRLHLRRHPPIRSRLRGHLGARVRLVAREAKVGNLEGVLVLGDQDVGGLEVAVQHGRVQPV